MPFSVERLPGEAIYVTKYFGKIDISDITAAGILLDEIWDRTLPRLVLLYDTDSSQIDFKNTLSAIRRVAGNEDVVSPKQDVILAFVGTTPMIKLFIDASQQKQFAGQKFPLFATMEDALTAMRILLAATPENSSAPSDTSS